MGFDSLDSFYLWNFKALHTFGLVAIISAFGTTTNLFGQLKQQSPTYTVSTQVASSKKQVSQETQASLDESIIFSKEYLSLLEFNGQRLEYNSQLLQAKSVENQLKVEQAREIHTPLQIETTPPKFNSKGDAGRYAGQAVADKIGFAMPYINAPLGNAWNIGSRDSHSQLKVSAGLRGLYQPLIKLDYKNALSSNFDVKLRSRWDKPAEFSIVKKLGKEKYGELPNEVGIYTDLEKDGKFNSYIIFQSDWNWFKNRLKK